MPSVVLPLMLILATSTAMMRAMFALISSLYGWILGASPR